MSLFRKPKKIQRRICADDDEDEEPEAPPPPIISREKKENKPAKTKTLLSFADEEEDGEMFKVKKSSQSKRLSKRREKEKKKVDVGDTDKLENDIEEKLTDNTDKPKHKKKVTLEGLILSGREALAADGVGDVSDESANEDERGFHQYRPESVRAALAVAPGAIPDAALIHAARKTRQQARELGGDYIPIRAESAGGSRLVREDGSGDEDEEGRILVRGLELPSDKPKRDTEAAPEDEEMDSEVDEWEEQQMQKAMPAIVDITGECGAEVNPFSVAPPPPRAAPPPHLRPLAEPRALASAADLLQALQHRLEEVQQGRAEADVRRGTAGARLERARAARARAAGRRARLAAAYRRAQALRGYITDLVECLDEKMPQLEALEARALALHRRRCSVLAERRRADVRDQAQDVLAHAGRAGAARVPDSEEKVRRTAEREGRRRARRLRREAAPLPHNHLDGDSSDDDLPPHDHLHYQQEREAISRLSAALFADAGAAWRSAGGVAARLARWRRRERALYADAYLPRALPHLLAPYVRHELILWNPLADEDNEDYEKMEWYKCLMMYGVRPTEPGSESEESPSDGEEEDPTPFSEQAVREDPDLFLVPTLVNKVVLPKLTELVEASWEPLCVRASVRLRAALERAAESPRGGAALRALAAAARARLVLALDADVFLPTLPPHVAEGPGAAFWRRCAGAGVRLLRAALALTAPPPALRADALVLQLIDTLVVGAGAAGGAAGAGLCAALGASLPRAGGGAGLRARALRRLAALAQVVLRRLHHDNPLHFKAIEQAKNIIAEAKVAEQSLKENSNDKYS